MDKNINKISISIKNKKIVFDKYYKSNVLENLDNTNVITTKNLNFTEQYIYENLDLISSFLNFVIARFEIENVEIKNLDIAPASLKLIEKLTSIKNINFTFDECLTYTVSSLLRQNKNIRFIECYSIPDIMFYQFKKNQIKTRSAITSTSEFLKYNNINTYSDLYNKSTITIDNFFTMDDIDDLKYFIETNKNLNKIIFKKYSNPNFLTILKLLNKNGHKNIKIIILESEENIKDLMEDMNSFDNLSKKYNVSIKIKYSKKYVSDNLVKELNLKIFKMTLIILVGVSITFLSIFKLSEIKSQKNVDKVKETINEIKENIKLENQVDNKNEENLDDNQDENNIVDNNDVVVDEPHENIPSNPSYTMSRVYSELKNINNDVVGWLTLNNTQIDYPVVQYSDNDYYLTHSFDKSSNIVGWVYADYRNNFDTLSKNTIIYGHSSVIGGLMFTTLTNTTNANWYLNSYNQIISFSVKGVEYKWQIYSIYTIENTNDYLVTDFSSAETFNNYVSKMKSRSIYNFNVDVDENDLILTLSTCYNTSDYRLVVQAKMIK